MNSEQLSPSSDSTDQKPDRVSDGSRFLSYSKYNDSGIEWLGQIPAHWECRRLKHVVALRNEKREVDREKLYIGMENVESWTGKLLDTELEVEGDGSRFSSGDVLFGKLRPYLAKALLITESGQCSSEFLVLEPIGLSGQFLRDLVLSQGFVNTVDASTYGAKMPRASWETVGGMGVPLPTENEQQAIADFLDHETAKIDALVEKKERLIELLREKRTALITRAVTKGLPAAEAAQAGLDPDVPMKDSGIEWLGEIPEHWEACRVKMVANLESGHTPSRQHPEYWEGCTVPWFGLADVWQIRGDSVEYVHETNEKVSELGLAHSSARKLPRGTVILSRTASVGFSAIMGEEMATTQDFANWIPTSRIQSEYLLYVMRAMRKELGRLVMGSTHKTIYMPDIASLATPIPPLPEQNQIVAHIRSETARIDALIAKVGEAIERLKEYRTALISAAVTGKIDVRNQVGTGGSSV